MVKKKQPAKKEVVAASTDITWHTQAEEALQAECDLAYQYLDIAGWGARPSDANVYPMESREHCRVFASIFPCAVRPPPPSSNWSMRRSFDTTESAASNTAMNTPIISKEPMFEPTRRDRSIICAVRVCPT
jgi:hypothetical protein